MITLGIDPGTALLGYGIVADDPEPAALGYGVVETGPDRPMAGRLLILFERLNELIRDYRPDVMAVEQLFFARNATTAIAVGQARGVVLLAAALANLPVVEYKPAEVKQAVVGYGKAEKHQVQEMIRLLLRLDQTPHPDDAADALAVALCHVQTAPFFARAISSAEGA
jgi:crossover junction endodeoxyribonuclease RuvC